MTASSVSFFFFVHLVHPDTQAHTWLMHSVSWFPADLNVKECLWSRKMSFAQWHRKHTVPSDHCSQSWFVSVCLSISVLDIHTHTHAQVVLLDTLGPLHCQHGRESSFCSSLISLWVLNWQLLVAEHSYY